MIKKALALVFICCMLMTGKAFAFPVLDGAVVDKAGVLSLPVKQELITLLENQKENQLVVVTLPSLEGKTIEDYAYQLGRHWGIGYKGADNGVLLILAPKENQLRIEVGYGLEGVLTDAVASKIINQDMVPLLKQKNYDKAVTTGVQKILEVIQNGAINANVATDDHVSTGLGVGLGIYLAVLLMYIFSGPRGSRGARLQNVLLFHSSLMRRGSSRGGFRGGGGSFGGGGSSGRY